MSGLHAIKASAFDEHGRLLVHACPMAAGFHGAPLALARGKRVKREKLTQRRNWAKRRAYGA